MDTNTNYNSFIKLLLNKDLQGNPQKEKWKYKTAVGILTYLQANTRT